VKTERTVRSSKGFLFESDDTVRPALCRDVRGFPVCLEAAQDRSKPHSGRLVIIVPDLSMDDWLARWADDVGHPRRAITITRRTDGRQLKLVGTLSTYGYGVETSIHIERLEQEGRTARRSSADEAPQSRVQEVSASRRQAASVGRRRAAR
jgi:hypothetical protein